MQQELFKLTTQDNTTYGGCLWGKNITHTADGQGLLCTSHWIHAYTNPLLAVFFNPIHAAIATPKLWRCRGEVGLSDNGRKVGCTTLTTIAEMELPIVTIEQCVRFTIGCALAVSHSETFATWATAWLNGTDRTSISAAMAAVSNNAPTPYKAAHCTSCLMETLDFITIAEWAVSDSITPPF